MPLQNKIFILYSYLRVSSGQLAIIALTASVCILIIAELRSFGAKWLGSDRMPSSRRGVCEQRATQARSSSGLGVRVRGGGLSGAEFSLSLS